MEFLNLPADVDREDSLIVDDDKLMYESQGRPSENLAGWWPTLNQRIEFESDQLYPWLVQLPLENVVLHKNDESSFYEETIPLTGAADLQMEKDSAAIEEEGDLIPPVEVSFVDVPPTIEHVDEPLPDHGLEEGVSTTGQKSQKPRLRIDPSKWEENRLHITNLYRSNALSETKRIMEDHHGFVATEKAYKEKIKEWKLKKNLSKREAIYMLHKSAERKIEQGKGTSFRYRNGAAIPNSKLDRFSKTKRGKPSKLSVCSVPSNITFITPQNSLSGTKVSTISVGDKPKSPHSQKRFVPANTDESKIPQTLLSGLESIGLSGKTLLFRSLLTPLIQQSFNSWISIEETSVVLDTKKDGSIIPSEVFGDLIHTRPDEALRVLVSSIQALGLQCGLIKVLEMSNPIWLLNQIAYGLATANRFADAEDTLERVPSIVGMHYGHDQQQLFRRLCPCTRLLLILYLYQGRFWRGELLVQSRLAKAELLFGAQSRETYDLRSLLLIMHTDGLSVDDEGEGLIIAMLEDIKESHGNIDTTLLILELLRGRYYLLNQVEKLLSVVQRIEQTLIEYSKRHECMPQFQIYIAKGLALSYSKLGPCNEAEWWASVAIKANSFSLESPLDKSDLALLVSKVLLRQHGKSSPEDAMTRQEWELLESAYLEETLTKDHPVIFTFTRYLKQIFL